MVALGAAGNDQLKFKLHRNMIMMSTIFELLKEFCSLFEGSRADVQIQLDIFGHKGKGTPEGNYVVHDSEPLHSGVVGPGLANVPKKISKKAADSCLPFNIKVTSKNDMQRKPGTRDPANPPKRKTGKEPVLGKDDDTDDNDDVDDHGDGGCVESVYGGQQKKELGKLKKMAAGNNHPESFSKLSFRVSAPVSCPDTLKLSASWRHGRLGINDLVVAKRKCTCIVCESVILKGDWRYVFALDAKSEKSVHTFCVSAIPTHHEISRDFLREAVKTVPPNSEQHSLLVHGLGLFDALPA